MEALAPIVTNVHANAKREVTNYVHKWCRSCINFGICKFKSCKKNQEEKVYFFGAALYFKIRNIVKIIKLVKNSNNK